MNNLKYRFLLLLSKLPLIGGGNLRIINALKKEGCAIGDNTHIFSNITAEPYLVTIGDNCTISTDVSLLTHDASIGIFMGREKYSDLVGKISIGNNCFIGNKAIIMYGVSIADNTIVAAGSVVTKSISEPGYIVGGNPARVVGSVSEFISKSESHMLNLHGKSPLAKRKIIMSSGKLIKR